jgi:ketosteroid isomerase-like protein
VHKKTPPADEVEASLAAWSWHIRAADLDSRGMDSHAPPRPVGAHPDSANLESIKTAFRVSADQGFVAGLEALLAIATEDCEFRPYTADRVLCGHDEIRAFYRAAADSGTDMKLKAARFREDGDRVVVDGTMRVVRPTGGFSESQICWTYRFRDGRLAEAGWGPRGSS